jgi:hypothetical protein
MVLSHLVRPVLDIGGPAVLVIAALRLGPDALLRLFAGTVAVMTRDKDRGQRCLEVLRLLRREPRATSGDGASVRRRIGPRSPNRPGRV